MLWWFQKDWRVLITPLFYSRQILISQVKARHTGVESHHMFADIHARKCQDFSLQFIFHCPDFILLIYFWESKFWFKSELTQLSGIFVGEFSIERKLEKKKKFWHITHQVPIQQLVSNAFARNVCSCLSTQVKVRCSLYVFNKAFYMKSRCIESLMIDYKSNGDKHIASTMW